MRPSQRTSGLSPRRRALLVATVLLLAIPVTVVAAALVLKSQSPGSVPSQDEPGAVLLVPGYGGGTGAVTTLAERIRATGRTVTVVALPGDATGDLALQAEALDRHVEDALRAGAPSVDVIGYSAGGVVARLWVQEHDGTRKARRIVTLGSPHHGANLAAAGAAAVPGGQSGPSKCRQQRASPGAEIEHAGGGRKWKTIQ